MRAYLGTEDVEVAEDVEVSEDGEASEAVP
jgi:hypothetical protein